MHNEQKTFIEQKIFKLHSEYKPTGDQPQAIAELVEGFKKGNQFQTFVKEINEGKDSEIKILYGDEDSRPMFLYYKGFKTEGEAREEMNNIMNHKDDYINALTVAEHINKRVSGSE